jgi:hypothetical protein
MNLRGKTWLLLALSVLISACSAHPRRVDCEGHLRAINAPAPLKPVDPVKP